MNTNSCRIRSTFAIALIALTSSARAQAPQPTAKTVDIDGPSVGRTLKYKIALPADYESSDKRYPVLYLLHGYSSNYLSWDRLGAPKAARVYDLIVVMPDAGNSWYANWAQSEEGQKNQWEDFIIRDLIGHVDSHYRTIASREGRAINGLSMGGYGALMLGLKHPDLFCAIGSHSGALAFAKGAGQRLKSGDDPAKAKAKAKGKRELSKEANRDIGIEGFSSQYERSPRGKLFATEKDAEAYDPFRLVVNIPHDKLPHIYIDCGTEDSLLKSSQDFMKILMENKIPFTYAQSEGRHAAPYWAREIGHSMAVQYQIIQRQLAARDKPKAETAKAGSGQ